jgi:hypothetical protein
LRGIVQLLDRLRDGIDIAAVSDCRMPAGGRAPIGRRATRLSALRLTERRLGHEHFVGGEVDGLIARPAPHLEQHQRATAADDQPEDQQSGCPSARAPHRRNIPNSDRCLYSNASRW